MTGARTPRHRDLCATLAAATCLSGCASPPTTAPPPVAFDRHQVVLDAAERPTVLTGFLLGGRTADLAVVTVDADGARNLRIHALGDGAWTPRVDAALRPDVTYVDVARIDGHDRLITYGAGDVRWFDPASASEQPLVAVTSDFAPPRPGEVPHVDVTRDVNGDGRDDLVVPDDHGFHVCVQRDGGAFADPVRVGPATGAPRVYGADGYRYDPWAPGRVHEIDHDRDGRIDLVSWAGNHFEVHHQDDRGLFTPATAAFTTDVAFDTDDLATLAAPYEVRRRERDHGLTLDLTGRVLHTLTDFDGDGVADLVVFALEGGSLARMRSTFEVHYGTATPDGVVFAADIGTAIESDGIPFGLGRHDFENDGQVDMMLTVIDPNAIRVVGMLLDAMLTRSVSLDLEFYRMIDGAYPTKPSATRTLRVRVTGESGTTTDFPPVLIGDVNGDGHSDLLIGRGRDELRIYLGVPGPDLFARRPQKLDVDVPGDEEYAWLVDLNGDGRQDVLMHHASPGAPHLVTMLIAR